MSTVYTETPNNIDEFKQFIIEDVNEIKKFFCNNIYTKFIF